MMVQAYTPEGLETAISELTAAAVAVGAIVAVCRSRYYTTAEIACDSDAGNRAFFTVAQGFLWFVAGPGYCYKG